jgi:nitrogen fixation-related uncharacterized protein
MIDEILDQLMAIAIVLVFVALIGFAGWMTSADDKAAEYIGAVVR